MIQSTHSLADIKYVHRVVVGNDDPQLQPDEEKYKRQLQCLNKCLTEYPKGRIIGQEKNFYIINIGEHQVVMQYIVYHVGFERKPQWIKE